MGDVERFSGVPATTIRHCEDLGLIEPLRSGNG
ncbi:MAG: MerR family DNA-binding transcriptional regulator [Notoacmeibacter sp.]|nr:MerR family DNA-binding transcriptional regulator [Notoacmeibacter sp.]